MEQIILNTTDYLGSDTGYPVSATAICKSFSSGRTGNFKLFFLAREMSWM